MNNDAVIAERIFQKLCASSLKFDVEELKLLATLLQQCGAKLEVNKPQ